MVVWIIGLSGAGKSVVGSLVADSLRARHPNTVFLDGDSFRAVMGGDLGHSMDDRLKNAERICRMCAFLSGQGIHVVCAILSLFPETRVWNRENIAGYFEVFLDASIEDIEAVDVKGIYRAYRAGEIDNVVGLDIPFPRPASPDLVIRNDFRSSTPRQLAEQVLAALPIREAF